MNTALAKQADTVEIVIPYDFRVKLEEIARKFEKKLKAKNDAQQKGVQNNREHLKMSTKAKMYISHFLQVVNMSIQRGEFPQDIRLFYGIDKNSTKLPPLASDNSLQKWGEKIIEGENNRMNKGGNRIYNPSIALVNINLQNFKKSLEKVTEHQKNIAATNDELVAYRPTADEYILKLWNILEEHFSNKPEEEARLACSEWGISYVYRKSELEKLNIKRYVESISPSLNL